MGFRDSHFLLWGIPRSAVTLSVPMALPPGILGDLDVCRRCEQFSGGRSREVIQ